MSAMHKSKKASGLKHFALKGVYPYPFAFLLLFPGRKLFLSQKKLVRRLALHKNDHILEVGPGPGFYSLEVAKKIPEGKLILADIQPEMLEYAKRRVKKRGLKNVEYHLCDGKTFPFKENSFDVIFLVAVLGEIENKEDYIKEFHRILKPGGLLSISELPADPDRMHREEIARLLEKEGFRFDHYFGHRRNYTIHYRR